MKKRITIGGSSNNQMNICIGVLFCLLVGITYLYIQEIKKPNTQPPTQLQSLVGMSNPTNKPDVFNDPYAPPLQQTALYIPPDTIYSNTPQMQGVVPVNVQTRGFQQEYSQIGIITREKGDMILPLMGRRIMNGRNRYQYYAISNTGSVNTKLPIQVQNKNCTSEYGCDEITSNDTVFVKGYNDTFKATVYENGLLSYLPVL